MDRYGRYPMTTLKQMVYTLLLAGMYFGASWSITHLGRDIGFALAISPAAGIALGALLCYGVRLWPGVWLGAFGFNLYFFNYITPLTDTTVFQEILIASGLGLAQVAQALGVSEADVMSVIESGELKAKKIGSSFRIKRSAVDAYLAD